MAELNCNIEVDFDLEQVGCHWELTRYFRIAWDTAYGKSIQYGLKNRKTGKTNYIAIDTTKVYTVGDSYIYELPFSVFTQDELIAARDDQGWISLTIYKDSNTKTFEYLLELPPVWTEAKPSSIHAEYVVNNPGESRCTWNIATELDGSEAENSPDSLDGYSIEVFYKPEKATEYIQLKGITWDKDELAKGTYKLVKDSTYKEPTVVDVSKVDLTGDLSFESTHTMSEVYIENPLKNEFYFTPKALGILPGSTYQIRVYPYSHYEGALISTDGAGSDEIKVPKGIVRVYDGSTWVEGIVYVMVYDEAEKKNVWKEADSIYTMVDDGTGNGVWKETT